MHHTEAQAGHLCHLIIKVVCLINRLHSTLSLIYTWRTLTGVKLNNNQTQ